ncbi:hypothetical protein B7R54_07175 [Subtercola boreus]|uniref:DUF3263 domain-containing protein n=1 Tax=Subtercola boreus TaxID=120213 RepID=A0A3E0VH92_9MICO|nr:hypothetical protein B7R54_07175 [Subtercola boreus]
MRNRFGISPTRYYMRLNRILSELEVHDLAPALARSLIERQDRRLKQRHDRPLPADT